MPELRQSDLAARYSIFIFGLALLARVGWHLLREQRDWADTAIYVQTGAELLKTGQMTSHIYMPGYPALLTLFGYEGILWVQFVLSAASAVLVAQIAMSIWQSRTAAMLSGLLAAFYPLLIFFANLRLSETLFIFFVLASFLALYRGYFTFGSVLLVVSILVRPAVDLLAPLLVIAFCMVRGELRLTLVLKRLAMYAAVYVVMMSPWWYHNYTLYGQFVRLNLGDGIHLRLENNPLFEKVGLDFEALADLWKPYANVKGAVAVNNALKADALNYVLQNPGTWMINNVRRFFMFWSPSPASTSSLVNVVSVATIVPAWLLLLVAMMGGGRRILFRAAPILLFVAFLTALHTVTHSLWRYRLPLDPLLLALAGGAILHPRLQRLLQPVRARLTGLRTKTASS